MLPSLVSDSDGRVCVSSQSHALDLPLLWPLLPHLPLHPLPHPREGIGATLHDMPVGRKGAGVHALNSGPLMVMSVLI